MSHFSDKATISGLASNDYSVLDGLKVPEFVVGNLKPIPTELKNQLNS